RRLGRGPMPASLPHGVVEGTRGPAISILYGFWMSFICDTYIVLTWNSRIKSGPGVHASSDEPHTRTQQNRRQGHAKEDQSQVAEQA
ncbi:small integral membrane protein 2, partial [Daubentonia madagascariensis]